MIILISNVQYYCQETKMASWNIFVLSDNNLNLKDIQFTVKYDKEK